ncbi:MAG: hypothetical protein KGI79_03600 [Patescibacteria group bacterium]|nr:hypothetical protein [Patescibacteria group bacterium]MDE2116933.1 hypothetical protein [Patescibacteria group bacterium]
MDTENTGTKSARTLALDGVKVVLNGGSTIMESATIPFRWFFSDAVIEQQPSHLLVIDQNTWEMERRDTDSRGERRIIPISQGSDFIQFSRPGKHRLAFIAFKRRRSETDDQFEEFCTGLLKQDEVNRYRRCVDWDALMGKAELGSDIARFLTATIVEVEVPDEFFATRSESGFARFIWAWANRWFKVPPRDQCDYRKRLILAFTIQPILFAIGRGLQYLVLAPILTVWVVISRLVVLWAGYRPKPFRPGLSAAWAWEFWEDVGDFFPLVGYWYRVWSIEPYKEMPITGFEVTMLLLPVPLALLVHHVYRILWSIKDGNVSNPHLLAVVITALMVLFITVIYCFFFSKTEVIFRTKWWRGIEKSHQAKHWARGQARLEKMRRETPLLYFEWLQQNARMSQAPDKVRVDELPDAFRRRAAQRARIHFWALKSKVCRPFPRS